MAVGLSASVVNGWLDSTFATATCWWKLHVSDPGAAGANGAAAGDTTRKQSTMNAASGGSKAASGSTGPWTNGGTSETVSHLSNWSASSAGTFQGSCALAVAQPWASGNTLTVTSVSISITPIAA